MRQLFWGALTVITVGANPSDTMTRIRIENVVKDLESIQVK